MSLTNKPIAPTGVAGSFYNPPQDGMTLLEHYAGIAMQGLCVNTGRNGFNSGEQIALQAVVISKALIAELEKEQVK